MTYGVCLEHRRLDLRSALARTLVSALVSTAVYTAFGFVLVQRHAEEMASSARLFRDHQMQSVAVPGDPYLVSLSHQLGGAVLFGMMLGATVSLVLCAAHLLARLLGCRGWVPGVLVAGGSVAAVLYLSLSWEAPVASVLSGSVAASFSWWLWGRPARERAGQGKRGSLRAVLFGFLLLLPLYPIRDAPFERIRDAMIDLPVARGICDFYYDHTLVPAHVVQPLLYRTQKVIAFSEGIEISDPMPRGSLWIESPDPCRIRGASLVVSREPLDCDSLVLPEADAPAMGTEVLSQGSRRFDGSSALRRGIRAFMHGTVPAVVILLALWLATLVERQSRIRKGAGLLFAAACLALAGQRLYDDHVTRARFRDPAAALEYLSSGSAGNRYLLVSRHPEVLSAQQLESLASDASAAVRHAALLRMGEWKDAGFLPALEQAVSDPVQIVRTKACLGLGEVGGEEALRVLEGVLARDSSWYVRDYAYWAMCSIRPVSKMVRMRPGSSRAPLTDGGSKVPLSQQEVSGSALR